MTFLLNEAYCLITGDLYENYSHYIAGFAFAALLASQSVLAVDKVDADIPRYKKGAAFSGKLTSVDSDTLANLMTLRLSSYLYQLGSKIASQVSRFKAVLARRKSSSVAL